MSKKWLTVEVQVLSEFGGILGAWKESDAIQADTSLLDTQKCVEVMQDRITAQLPPAVNNMERIWTVRESEVFE